MSVRQAQDNNGRFNMIIFAASTAIMSFQPLVLHLANERGTKEEKMGPDTFMLAAELLKIGICAAAVLGRRILGLDCRVWCSLRHTFAFSVPAALYLVMNIMKVFAARAITPPVFQLLASTKILATAVASWALLNRHLTRMQWAAMLVLMVGVALGQQTPASVSSVGVEDVPLLPTVVMFVNSGLSSLGAVYTERVLKAHQSAVLTTFATNLHMSGHTLLMSAAKACFWEATVLPRPWTFGPWTWAALINEAVNGLLVAALMRHADSIVKNYAFGASIFLTVGLSAPLLSYTPQPFFFIGACLVLMSMYLYARGGASDVFNGKGQNGVSKNGHIFNGSNGSSQNGHTSHGTNGHEVKKD